MCACVLEFGRGFFEGVCRQHNHPLDSQDPPLLIRELTPASASHSKGERGKKKGPERNSPDPATRQRLLRGLRQEVEVLVASAAKGDKVLQPFLRVRFIRPMMNV
jgi:hypothetical protein